ncbi:ankyrin [Plenodomus tracheiphilus IPT5]|uniref:Ankyrin n=1 Tax=Plenodomus tracheiphilus IPT5 TaxID=1408161 RepID=A0A6A7AVG3_9PLEO|nr:ankyrin [Plenodomus tracheiphilus IPT5]
MAEPLSIAASIIAVIGATEKAAKGLERLRTLQTATDELEYVLNEINDMRVVLRSTHNALTSMAERETSDIGDLIKRCEDEVLELDMLVTYSLQDASGYRSNGRPKVNTLGWLLKSGRLSKIRGRLRDRRESLVVALIGSLFTVQRGIKLDIQDISLVSHNRPDYSLVRMDHPQAASMQSALEQLLSNSRLPPTTIRHITPTSTNGGVQTTDQVAPQRLAVQTSNPSGSLRVTTLLSGKSCGSFCQCQCHVYTHVHTPQWLSGIFGIMFGSYQGTPRLKARPCNYKGCQRSAKTTSHYTYYFPSRFLNAALTIANTWKDVASSGGSWHVSMPQIVSDQDPIWGTFRWDAGEIMKMFQQRRASPYMVRSTDGDSILFWAIHHWRIDLCEYLVCENANRYIQNKKGSSPNELAWTRVLSLVAPGRTEEIARLRLLFEDYDPFDNLGFTVLHMIVTDLKDDSLESILENDTSSINKADNQNKTPLMWAAGRGDCVKVAKLLEYGASTTSKDREGRTALSWAAWSGSSGCAGCVRKLLEHGADPNVKDTRNSETPLHWALKGLDSIEIVQTLLSYGARIGPGYYALHRAAISGSLENATILLDRGADIDEVWRTGSATPLLLALLHNNPPIARLLLERGAKVKVWDNGTLLHTAARICDRTVFDMLTAFDLSGITADEVDTEGNTAWDIFQHRRGPDADRGFPSEHEYEVNRASLARLLELGKFG